jgi:hypothetical protein
MGKNKVPDFAADRLRLVEHETERIGQALCEMQDGGVPADDFRDEFSEYEIQQESKCCTLLAREIGLLLELRFGTRDSKYEECPEKILKLRKALIEEVGPGDWTEKQRRHLSGELQDIYEDGIAYYKWYEGRRGDTVYGPDAVPKECPWDLNSLLWGRIDDMLTFRTMADREDEMAESDRVLLILEDRIGSLEDELEKMKLAVCAVSNGAAVEEAFSENLLDERLWLENRVYTGMARMIGGLLKMKYCDCDSKYLAGVPAEIVRYRDYILDVTGWVRKQKNLRMIEYVDRELQDIYRDGLAYFRKDACCPYINFDGLAKLLPEECPWDLGALMHHRIEELLDGLPDGDVKETCRRDRREEEEE